jgi:hypothetical protein
MLPYPCTLARVRFFVVYASKLDTVFQGFVFSRKNIFFFIVLLLFISIMFSVISIMNEIFLKHMDCEHG